MSNEKSRSWSFRMELSGGFLLLLSLTGFLCGLNALGAAVLAAAAHELGHLALILSQGSLPRRLTLDASGACLHCFGPAPAVRQELLRALAGPAAGAAYWLMLRFSGSEVLRASAQMSLMLSLVNLLPASGLDGGRVVTCLLADVPMLRCRGLISVLPSVLSALLTLFLGILHSPQLFLYGLWLTLRMVRTHTHD